MNPSSKNSNSVFEEHNNTHFATLCVLCFKLTLNSCLCKSYQYESSGLLGEFLILLLILKLYLKLMI